MAEVFQGIGKVLTSAYNELISAVPPTAQSFIKFFVISLLIVLYCLFIWKFYKTIAKKNLIELNLSKYNKSKHPVTNQLIAGGLFLLEYLLIVPFAVFLWFSALTIFLILLAESASLNMILILSATTIAAIRMISYHNEELSSEVAKLIPLTLLATSLFEPNFFSVERILGQIQAIPGVFGNVLTYLLFIVILELILRLLDFLLTIFGFEDKMPKPKKDED